MAKYHKAFGAYGIAAELLLSSVNKVNVEDRGNVLRQAISALTHEKRFDDASRQAVAWISSAGTDQEIANGFLGLANVAKSIEDRNLEAACLEQMLVRVPADSDSRFRLAYLYSEMKRSKMAAYHYRVIQNNTHMPVAVNNLGAEYEQMKLPASEIECYKKASEENQLSKANMAAAYLQRGFLDEALDLAKEVTEDGNAGQRARYVIQEIESTRQTEEKKIAAIPEETRPYSEFLSDYAKAYASGTSKVVVDGLYKTRYGEIPLHTTGAELVGEGTRRRPWDGGLFASALRSRVSPAPLGLPLPPTMQVITLSLKGRIYGLTATFTLVIRTRLESEREEDATTRTVDGLLILSPDGQSLRMLEAETDKDYSVGTATRLP